MFSGYLRAEAVEAGTTHVPAYRLSIPNDEVREVYISTFRDWMEERLSGQGAWRGRDDEHRRARTPAHPRTAQRPPVEVFFNPAVARCDRLRTSRPRAILLAGAIPEG
ncbi:hypothetical protein WME79_42310 [Sorangium sp. So ce726]|uniref:hypothetical protein n=1 Tax=Sorangium sp. So ce726 TaxID=3133319 RepID=UPI003F5E5F78